MKTYDPDEKCPKCGGERTTVQHIIEETHFSAQFNHPEEMFVRCVRCGWHWLRAPLDAKGEEKMQPCHVCGTSTRRIGKYGENPKGQCAKHGGVVRKPKPNPLAVEEAYFEERREGWLDYWAGRWVAIKGRNRTEFYDSEARADNAAVDVWGADTPVLVKQVLAEDPIVHTVEHPI